MSQNSLLVLKDSANDANDTLTWQWMKGEATTKTDFGDPLTTTDYTLCLYDETGGVPSLLLSATAPAGGTCAGKPCWKETKKGFKYQDKERTLDGLAAIVLKEGNDGKARVTARGKGANLVMPALPLDTKVTVQLVNTAGVCWDAEYSTPAIKNQNTRFRDKAD